MLVNIFNYICITNAYPNIVNVKIVMILCSLDPLADVTSSQIWILIRTPGPVTDLLPKHSTLNIGNRNYSDLKHNKLYL